MASLRAPAELSDQRLRRPLVLGLAAANRARGANRARACARRRALRQPITGV
jgi:hypothetical protein